MTTFLERNRIKACCEEMEEIDLAAQGTSSGLIIYNRGAHLILVMIDDRTELVL